jgi:uncharacterized protein involved in exopolysaccharide biosynthesis
MNKFEGIIKKVAGYDSMEEKYKEKFNIRKDIRERAKFPPQIQNILSKIDKLDDEEEKLRASIHKISQNSKNQEDETITRNLEEQLQDIQNRQVEIYRDLNEILSKDKELHDALLQYQLKKEDELSPEDRKFSEN